MLCLWWSVTQKTWCARDGPRRVNRVVSQTGWWSPSPTHYFVTFSYLCCRVSFGDTKFMLGILVHALAACLSVPLSVDVLVQINANWKAAAEASPDPGGGAVGGWGLSHSGGHVPRQRWTTLGA